MKKIRFQDALSSAAGLSADQAAIYAALAEKNPATVAGIARAAGLYRTDVYAALPGLKKLGLATAKTVGKRTAYSPAPAARLRLLAEKRLGMLPKLLAGLERKEKPAADGPVRILRGPEGLAAVLEDLTASLQNGSYFYRITSRKADTDVERYMPRNYRAERDRKKLEQFVITNAALRAKPFRKRVECLSRAVPRDQDPFEFNVAQLIYGRKVAFVDYNTETAIVIDNPMLAKFQEKIFKLLFQRL